MNTKKLAGAGAAAIGAATAVTALLLGSTAAVADESFPDYAFGLSATGALSIEPLPYVKSLDGEQVEDQLLGIGDVLGAVEDDIAFGVLTAEARGGAAETAVTELNLLQLLRADLVRTWCENGEGGLQIVNGTILGQPIPDTAVPGQRLDVSPLLTLTLNDQRRNSDGSLTVTGIEFTVLPGAAQNLDKILSPEEQAALPALGAMIGAPLTAGATTVGDVVEQLNGTLGEGVDLTHSLQTVTIGAANCHGGNGDGGHDDGKDDDGKDNGDGGDDAGDDEGNGTDGAGNDVPAAPSPSVVAASLPVTG